MDERPQIWTAANVVTIVRLLLIPVFVAVFLAPWPSLFSDTAFWTLLQPWISALIFAIISFTDCIDGYLSRHRQEVSDFGKFLDPLADKILVAAALLVLVESRTLPSWIALIILAREFIVSGVRMMAAARGVVIAASYYGKVKTVLQIIGVLLFLVKDSPVIAGLGQTPQTVVSVVAWVVMICAIIMTLISMIDYLAKSRELLGLPKRKSDDSDAQAPHDTGADADEKG